MANILGTYGKNGLGYSVELFNPDAPKTVIKTWNVPSDDSQVGGGINDTFPEGSYHIRFKALGGGSMVVYINKWNGSRFQQIQKKRKVRGGRSTTYKNVMLDGGGWSFTNGFFVF